MGRTLQFVTFVLDDHRYAVPLGQVDCVIRAVDSTPLPHAPPGVIGAMDLHGKLVPVLCIRTRLNLATRPVSVDDQFIIARASRRTVALVVDRVEEVVACAPSSIVPPEKVVGGWGGAEGVMQMEGGLIVIYDLDRFLSLQEDAQLATALEGQVADGA